MVLITHNHSPLSPVAFLFEEYLDVTTKPRSDLRSGRNLIERKSRGRCL